MRREELHVRLVEQDHGFGRHSPHEPFDVGGRFDGAGRVVRPAHHHDPRRGGGVGHRVEIVVTMRVEWNGDRLQPRHLGEDRIPVERR